MGMNEPFLPSTSGHGEGETSFRQSDLTGEASASQEKILLGGESSGTPRIESVRRLFRKLFFPNHIHRRDELYRFQTYLFFLGLDQSTPVRSTLSWVFFVFFIIVVPLLNWVYVSCEKCDFRHSHPFQNLVDCSESALGAISFLFLSNILRKYGLKKALLLDKLGNDSITIRERYENDLHNSWKILAYILLPCMAVETAHKVWFYFRVSIDIPFLNQIPIANFVLCCVSLVAWFYKSSVFVFVCVLFRLMCSLQLHRLEGYIKLLEQTSDVSTILMEHMRIRDQLLMISHRFRIFVILSMFTITFSQLASLFVITDSQNAISFFRSGDIAVCSIFQLSGFVLCLHGAAKITHRAQRIMSIVSQWHAVVTCSPSTALFSTDMSSTSYKLGPAHPLIYNNSCSDLENSIAVAVRSPNAVPLDIEAYQQRQALIGYLQFSSAGISLYGFRLDRIFLSSMCEVQFSMSTFLL